MEDLPAEIRTLANQVSDLGYLTAAWTLLGRMQAHGSAVLLSWDEADGLWECSWITGGDRFTSHSILPDLAVCGAARQALDGLGVLPGGS